MRIQEISKPYVDRGEVAPQEILAREFKTICDEYEDIHDEPLRTAEMQALANKFVPRAIEQIARRNQHRMEVSA